MLTIFAPGMMLPWVAGVPLRSPETAASGMFDA
jgi:hypothetical protein